MKERLFQQQTVRTAFSVSGIGLHSGAAATLTVRPGAADTGFVFIRTDIADRDNVVPAQWDKVVDARLCTVIANASGVTVSTVEHLLAAFAALGLDNAAIEIDGPEIPIMDGSARDFVAALDRAGLEEQPAPRKVLRVRKPVTVRDGDKYVTLSPADGSFFDFEIVFDNALIGRQSCAHALTAHSFRRDIAEARTFCLMQEVEMLRSAGLIKGGSLDNAVVVDGDRVLNDGGLRFPDEFARHKTLDAIGDLYLAGAGLRGRYAGYKAGHAMNNKVLRALFADPAAYEIITCGADPWHVPAHGHEAAVRA